MKPGPYKFSQKSLKALENVDPRLRKVLTELIKHFDFVVLEGYRSPAEQRELYAQGRTKPGQIVTKIDGLRVKGKHNYLPAKAVDIAPYPLDWNNRERFVLMAGMAIGIAAMMGIDLRWGGDWNEDNDTSDGWDLPHLELKD